MRHLASQVQYDRKRPIRVSKIAPVAARCGFTLVELMVVVVIIVILISAVLVASSTLIDSARGKSTRMILTIVRDAVDQFSSEQTKTATLARTAQGGARYKDRYGTFPPDEIEVFTIEGLPTALGGSGTPGSLGTGNPPARIEPGPGTENIGPMMFHTQGLPDQVDQAREFRDQTAMLAAIEMYSEAATSILDKIPDRNRSQGIRTPNGNPVLFLDRSPTVNGNWNSSEDWEIRHILDDWGVPIGYMSQRDWAPPPAMPIESTNFMGWNQSSTQLVKLNGNQPVIFSYGPNGKDQLTSDAMNEGNPASGGVQMAASSLIADWIADLRMDHPLNSDTIYANPELEEKAKKGLNP